MSGTLFFLAIETFETRRALVSETETVDAQIEDTIWENLMKKWFVPIESGDTMLVDDEWVSDGTLRSYTDNLSETVVSAKPAMFTSEAGNIISYVLDFVINDLNNIINPDITNDGNDQIKQLSGGNLVPDEGEEDEGGLTWTVLDDEGVVLQDVTVGDETTEEDFKSEFNISGVTEDPLFPSPFLLFNRNDIS